MRRTDFLKLGLGVALTPLIKVLPADAQPLDVIADEPLPAKPVTLLCASASSSVWNEEFLPRVTREHARELERTMLFGPR